MRTHATKAVALVLVTLGLASPACSLHVSGEADQCTTDDDCRARGPDFVGTGCAKAGPRAGFCVDSAEPLGEGECAANADCVDLVGPGAICASASGARRRCVQVITPECPIVHGNPFVEGTHILGVIGEVAPDDPGYARDYAHLAGAKVALDELQSERGVTLPGKRRFAIVGCTSSRPRAAGARLAALGAKAIVGPTSEEALQKVVEQTAPAEIPVLAGALGDNTASGVKGAESTVFLFGPGRDAIVSTLGAALLDVAPEARTPQGKVRLAVVLGRGRDLLGQTLTEKLVFNEKTAVINQNDTTCGAGGCYRVFDASKLAPAQLADELATFAPTVVVPLTDSAWGSTILPIVEQRFASATTKPIYLHVVLDEEDMGYRVQPNDPAFRKRVLGIWPSRDEGTFTSFRDRFRRATSATAGSQGPSPTLTAARAYDLTSLAFYAAYLAAFRGAGGAFEGADVTKALPDVMAAGARRVGPGPVDVPSAIAELSKGAAGRIDFDGVVTALDPMSGRIAPQRWQTFCVDALGAYVGGARTYKDGKGEGGTPGLCR